MTTTAINDPQRLREIIQLLKTTVENQEQAIKEQNETIERQQAIIDDHTATIQEYKRIDDKRKIKLKNLEELLEDVDYSLRTYKQKVIKQ